MKTFCPLFVVLLLFVAFSNGANAKAAVGTLEGIVTDVHGKAIAGATVTIQTSDGQHPHATRTDTNGHFAFTQFEIGQYDLRAYSLGAYSDWSKRVPIRVHKATQIVLRVSGAKT